MSILLRFLILLACGPLLLPAGYCVCMAGEPHCATQPAGHDSDEPDDDHHAPGCPAAVLVEALSLNGPTAGEAVALLPTPLVIVAITPAFETRLPSERSPLAPSPKLPLYLSHCTLVI